MKEVSLIQFGLGTIGRVLAREIANGDGKIRLVAILDSKNCCIDSGGISSGTLEKILNFKENHGEKPEEFKKKPKDFRKILKKLSSLKNLCVVDVTDSEEMYDVFLYALKNGMNVVTANKKPLCVPFSEYEKLLKAQKEKNTLLGYEATVGAGFPIIAKLNLLMKQDDITQIDGFFNVTLSYILSELGKGRKFYDIVKEARERGYTEPDPREDLSGNDLARKALILARTIGLNADFQDVTIDSLIPKSLQYKKSSAEEFMNSLKTAKNTIEEKVKNARKKNSVLKYAASIEQDRITVGLKEFPIDSDAGKLKYDERLTLIKTKKRDEKPLFLKGKGAGPKATVGWILRDISELTK